MSSPINNGCIFWFSQHEKSPDNDAHITPLEDIMKQLLRECMMDCFMNSLLDDLFCVGSRYPEKNFVQLRTLVMICFNKLNTFDFQKNLEEGKGKHFMLMLDEHGILSEEYKRDLEEVKMIYTPLDLEGARDDLEYEYPYGIYEKLQRVVRGTD